jgi:hypothetical protein
MSRVAATELDYRESGWIEVSLLWDRDTDELVVSVRDTASGDAFEIAVENNADALDVFHHPYAYAPEFAAQHDHARLTRPRSRRAEAVLRSQRAS